MLFNARAEELGDLVMSESINPLNSKLIGFNRDFIEQLLLSQPKVSFGGVGVVGGLDKLNIYQLLKCVACQYGLSLGWGSSGFFLAN